MRNTHILPPLLSSCEFDWVLSNWVFCCHHMYIVSSCSSWVFLLPTWTTSCTFSKIHCSLVYACLLSINSRPTVILVFRGRKWLRRWSGAYSIAFFFLTGLLVWHHSMCGCWVIGCRMKCRGTLRGHVDSVNGIMWQLYTSIICTASSDKTVSLWDARSSLCVQTFYGHKSSCNHAAFDKKVYSYWLLRPFSLHFAHFAPLVSVVGWCIFKTSWTRNLTENSSP